MLNKCIINTYAAIMQCMKLKGKLESKMKSVSYIRQHCSIAKQAGFMPTSWLAINSLSYDRTPEGNTPGSQETKV